MAQLVQFDGPRRHNAAEPTANSLRTCRQDFKSMRCSVILNCHSCQWAVPSISKWESAAETTIKSKNPKPCSCTTGNTCAGAPASGQAGHMAESGRPRTCGTCESESRLEKAQVQAPTSKHPSGKEDLFFRPCAFEPCCCFRHLGTTLLASLFVSVPLSPQRGICPSATVGEPT